MVRIPMLPTSKTLMTKMLMILPFFQLFYAPSRSKQAQNMYFKKNSPGDGTKCRPLLISYKRETFEITVSEFKILESAFEKNKRIDVKFFSTWDEKELSFRVNLKPNAAML